MGNRPADGRLGLAESRAPDHAILIIILLAVIIAQVGFWDTLGGLLGAAAMMLLFVLLLAATVALVAYWLFRRVRRRF